MAIENVDFGNRTRKIVKTPRSRLPPIRCESAPTAGSAYVFGVYIKPLICKFSHDAAHNVDLTMPLKIVYKFFVLIENLGCSK